MLFSYFVQVLGYSKKKNKEKKKKMRGGRGGGSGLGGVWEMGILQKSKPGSLWICGYFEHERT